MSTPDAHRRTLRVLPLYRYFALCDWLVEPGIAETNTLLALARRSVAASDQRQMVICPVSTTFVTVQFESLASQPVSGDDELDGWDDHLELRLECPSGKIYIDQPTALAIDMQDALAAGAGTYAVRVAWRGRRPDPGQDEGSAAGTSEEYLLQMWPVGPLSPATSEEFDSDDD